MLMEGELWPNLILGASRNGVSFPVSFINILFDMDCSRKEQHELQPIVPLFFFFFFFFFDCLTNSS